MAKDTTDLLNMENSTIVADAGYYNGTEKNCIDDEMKVYIKKQELITVPRTMNFVKRSFYKTRNMLSQKDFRI